MWGIFAGHYLGWNLVSTVQSVWYFCVKNIGCNVRKTMYHVKKSFCV